MKLAVLKETAAHEYRVAVTPDLVKLYDKLGIQVSVETGAGMAAGFPDKEYQEAGATVSRDAKAISLEADIFLAVQPSSLPSLKKDAILAGSLLGDNQKNLVADCQKQHLSAFSMELMPRITRAQTMDILSSQSNLAGYKAVIEAVAAFGKVVPMMMTAAGTVYPAKVLVLGAGVAGLQAIATAKRLGAIVSAFDVRPAAKEQVESLGASFIAVASEEQGESKGGYAKEMSDDYKRKQADLIQAAVKEHDIVITTALIPGKPAPVLLTQAMVMDMKPGSVIVDMATAAGGNCELSRKDQQITKHDVIIIGYSNLPARVPYHASRLYAKNLYNFITLLVDTSTKTLRIPLEDEIIKNTLLTHQGHVVHSNFKEKNA